MSLTVAHSGVICGPLSTPIFSATLPLLYSSGWRGPTAHCEGGPAGGRQLAGTPQGRGPTRVFAVPRQYDVNGELGLEAQGLQGPTQAEHPGARQHSKATRPHTPHLA